MSFTNNNPRAVINGHKGGKVRGKHHVFARFNLHDLAKAINVSYWSILLYLKETDPADLKKMSLGELVDWIVVLRTKRPLNTNVPRSKPTSPKLPDDTW